MSNQEFRDHIKAICGLKPEGFYNPPAQHEPFNHNCQCAECATADRLAEMEAFTR
ncbi:MAG TPA: hypothetical protein VFA85_12775 [Terriglobales bacterium]|nr:hypothetical protein [Terriglobales bacterium]